MKITPTTLGVNGTIKQVVSIRELISLEFLQLDKFCLLHSYLLGLLLGQPWL
jgi:hypothetical protein